jgi:putative flippase GtrA
MMLKLKSLIRKVFEWKYARFLIVGVSGTLISMSILYVLTEYLHIYYLISFIIGTIAGSINNYLWSKHWVFK